MDSKTHHVIAMLVSVFSAHHHSAFAAEPGQSPPRGLKQAADETLSNGFTGTWTDNFAHGLCWIGENKRWRAALNVDLNASGKGDPPAPGFAILPVLEGISKKP